MTKPLPPSKIPLQPDSEINEETQKVLNRFCNAVNSQLLRGEFEQIIGLRQRILTMTLRPADYGNVALTLDLVDRLRVMFVNQGWFEFMIYPFPFDGPAEQVGKEIRARLISVLP